jgi:hypothetical protein
MTIHLPRISLQSRRLDAGDGANLVVVRGVAADADRAEQNAAVLDQDAAGHRHQTALRQRIHRTDEIGLFLRPLEQRARTHAQRRFGVNRCRAVPAVVRRDVSAGRAPSAYADPGIPEGSRAAWRTA